MGTGLGLVARTLVVPWESMGLRVLRSSSNVPGARDSSATWIDSSGNLWLFGGNGYDSYGNQGN